jgi:hypothetical protein
VWLSSPWQHLESENEPGLEHELEQEP